MPRRVNARLEQVVRAQRDEPVALHPPAAPQHLLDRRAQVVVADQRETCRRRTRTPRTCASRNACWVSRSNAITNAAPEKQARIRNRYDLRRCPAITTSASPQSTSASTPGSCTCGTNTSPTSPSSRRRRRTYRAPPLATPRTPCSSTSRSPDPLRRVPLLARRLPIRDQPRVDQLADTGPASAPAGPPAACAAAAAPTQAPAAPSRRCTPCRRANSRIDKPLPLPIPPDLLEQLHSRSHPFCDLPSELRKARTVESRSDGGGAKSSVRSGANSDVRTYPRP